MSYDAVVIGSGPNGLSAAIALAQAGAKVVVLEAADSIGGGTRTAELTLPGFHHDHCSAVHPMAIMSPFWKKLPLAEYGLKWLYPEASVAHPLEGEESVILRRSLDETAAGLGADGKAWRNLVEPFLADYEALMEDAMGSPGIPSNPIMMTRFATRAFRSAEGLARSRFKGHRAQALFAGCAAHSILPLDMTVSAAVAVMFAIVAHVENWPVAEGGSAKISNALASLFRSLGGEIETGRRVHSLKDLPETRVVLFDTDPRQLESICSDELPSAYRKRLKKFRYGPAGFKLDWALDGPIPWSDPQTRLATTVHVGGRMEELAVSERDAWEGRHCDKPYVLLCQQSEVDPSRAPEGKHTGYAYCHVPHGSKVDMTEVIERQIERFAPGFRDQILARHKTTPAGFEAHNLNNLGGVITGGVADLTQLLTRPVVRLDPYSTPNSRLYICSASAPPGGGVHGMCGYNAAQSALKKLPKLSARTF